MHILLASQVRESVVFHAMLFFDVPRMCCACAVHPSYMCRERGCVLAVLIFPACVACELYGWYSDIARCVRHSSNVCTACVCQVCAMHVCEM